MFSCGFIMFEILAGKHPCLLKGEDKPTYRKRMKDYIGLPVSKYSFSNYANDILLKLGHPEPKSRLTIDQVIDQPWLNKMIPSKELIKKNN
jgi:serine/threonine protein kinase